MTLTIHHMQYNDTYYVAGFVDTEFEAKFVFEAIHSNAIVVNDKVTKHPFHAFNLNFHRDPVVEVCTYISVSDFMGKYVTLGMPR